jgi:hypothetical protein
MGKSAKNPPANGDTSSPKKGASGSAQKYKPSPQKTSPKKEGKKPKIVNLKHPDGTCYGWAFFNFYNAKEELKSLSNRDGMATYNGGIEFKPFSNLTTKWLQESLFAGFIWVIRIDVDQDGAEHCFPMTAHEAYGNKIARGVIAQDIWEKGEVTVATVTLTHAQAHDLDERFSVVPPRDAAADNIFNEAIRAADSELEDLI